MRRKLREELRALCDGRDHLSNGIEEYQSQCLVLVSISHLIRKIIQDTAEVWYTYYCLTIKKINSHFPSLVRLTKNETGSPMEAYFHALDKLQGSTESSSSIDDTTALVHDRLTTIEGYIRIENPSKADLFNRIKDIEDRLLILESLSPEYTHFIDYLSKSHANVAKQKKSYSSLEIDNLIANINHSSGNK